MSFHGHKIPGTAPALQTTLEEGVRLSRSRLWQWQRRYFDKEGARVWQQGTVPHYITSNAFIAEAYARVVLGYLRDCAPAIDPEQPVYVIELGAGVGRFGFHFLGSLRERLARSPLAGLRVQYVLTDFTDTNLAYYRGHVRLQPLFASGELDCARFDVDSSTELSLWHSGVSLAPGGVRNPVVFIANYVFDGVPQDAFYVEKGQLHESLLRLSAEGPIDDLDDPRLLARAELRFSHRLLTLPYYEEVDLDRVLLSHGQGERTGAFLFPCAALSCLHRLAKLGGERWLLLSADKGQHHLDDVIGVEPRLALHGSFSVMVNYHAMAEWVRFHGGESLHSAHRQSSLSLNAFRFGQGAAKETRLAFAEHLESGGPDDLFHLKKAVDYRYETLTPEQLLSLLRLSAFDAKVLLGCMPALKAHIAAGRLDAAARADLLFAMERAQAKYFPISETPDLPTALAELRAALERPAKKEPSAPHFGHSFARLRLVPPSAKTRDRDDS